MGFTRFEDNVSVHQGLSDEPNIEEGLTSEELKKKFDEPAEKIKKTINDLMDELENISSAGVLGAKKISDNDNSNSNIQAKLENLQSQITVINETNINTSKIEDNAITTPKISDKNITTEKLADNSITTNKINNGSVTGEKIDENVKKALNITATTLNEQDTSEANVQAKLNKIYQDLIGMTQGSVADNSIVTEKLASSSVTTEKIANNSVTREKINFGLYLVPSGFIGMWSGSTVPDGWFLCDGTNGTPDLRDRFIVSTGNSYEIGDVGGSNSVTLTVNQIPSHSHSYEKVKRLGGVRQTSAAEHYYENTVSSNTGSTGGGQAHENRPPYYALAFIMKA